MTFSGDVFLSTGQPNSPVVVGRDAVGMLQLDNGSVFTSGSTQFGIIPSGVGFGTVTGPKSTWNMGKADVGLSGLGRLDIQDGRLVNVISGLTIGASLSGHGTVAVDGDSSTLLVRSPLTIGGFNNGVGLLEITDGAIVSATQANTTIGPQGRVRLDGGLLRVSSLTNNGQIMGTGELNFLSSASMVSMGRIAVNEGDVLRVTGPHSVFDNKGAIQIDGGEMEFHRPCK